MPFSDQTEALIEALQEKRDHAKKAEQNAADAVNVLAAAKRDSEQANRERDAALSEVQSAHVEAMKAIERELRNPPPEAEATKTPKKTHKATAGST